MTRTEQMGPANTFGYSSLRQRWLYPFFALWGLALGCFAVLYVIDQAKYGVSQGTANHHPFESFWRFDPELASNAISSLVALLVALLGIVITVVSIVVQLSAQLYSGVGRMFLRERTNILVLGFYIVACIFGVWISFAARRDFAPRLGIAVMILLTTAGIALVAPYFSFVFRLLEPSSIIARIREEALAAARAARNTTDEAAISALQSRMAMAFENITDLASGAVASRDVVMASQAVDALRDVVSDYLPMKAEQPQAWFTLGAGLRRAPSFVALDSETKFVLEDRQVWVEWQVMQQYLRIYRQALIGSQELNYLIAIDTRYIAEAGAFANDVQLLRLTGRFLNSYVRAALNARDIRMACNVMNQIRLLVETLLNLRRNDDALAMARQMSYYGTIALNMDLPFVTETVAHDLGALCQRANRINFPEEVRLIGILLGQEQLVTSSKPTPLGVLKARAKLGVFYLFEQKPHRAAVIREHLFKEPFSQLQAVRDSLSRNVQEEFWEVVERGYRDFDHLPTTHRDCLGQLFAGLGAQPSPATPSVAP
jgi:Predicted membrane protein (DUF2254)